MQNVSFWHLLAVQNLSRFGAKKIAALQNFYDFACYAKAKLNVEQLLYLDGTISHMYMKGGAIPWQRYPFVTMISVERKG